MPGFKIEKIIAAGHAAFSRQCGPYVAPGAISSLADNIEAAGFEATKTGVKFSKKSQCRVTLLKRLPLPRGAHMGFNNMILLDYLT